MLEEKSNRGDTPSADPANLKDKALGPAADQFGRELAPLGAELAKTTTLVGTRLLSAVNGLVYGYDKVGEWLRGKIAEKLKGIPEENLVEPDPRIVVPAVQALTYSMNDEHIRDMFANLLAADMNADLKKDAHPAFTELIKEMATLDALVLRQLSTPQVCFRIRFGTTNRWQEYGLAYSFAVTDATEASISRSLNNLVRLGLVRETPNEWRNIPNLEEMEEAALKRFENVAAALQAVPVELRKSLDVPDGSLFARRDGFILSPLGEGFLRICLP